MTAALASLMGGLLLLFGGGEAVVRGAASVGLRLGITPLVTGLTIVAFGTSAPELVVSLQAAISGEGGLAIGNVVGSNVCNIGLILGISTLIKPALVDSKLVRIDVPIMVVSGLVVVAFLLDGHLSRGQGGILVAGILAHIVYTVRKSQASRRSVQADFKEAVPESSLSPGLSCLLVMIGLAALVFGGRLFVHGAIFISESFGIAPAVIGLTVAALGTSLPELATSIVAAMRGYSDMAVGNVVGSNIFNSLSVLGVTAMTTPLSIGAVTAVDLAVMVVASALALRLMSTQARMERWEGLMLLTGYVAYVAWLYS